MLRDAELSDIGEVEGGSDGGGVTE